MKRRFAISGMLVVGVVVAACTSSASRDDERVSLGIIEQPLVLSKVTPLAKINVKTAGELDVEETYLPQVVCCENGAAPLEALKAQAVMARTYMAFRYFGDGGGTAAKPLTGTTSDQAYFCAQKVSQNCRDATSSTKGQITSYANAKGDRFANVSFFVDGPRPSCIAQKSCSCPKPSAATSMTIADHPADCACFTFASQGAANPAYVTYNWANSGTTVVGSTIGDPKNESNRGCGSQNIQSCLSYAGWSYADMLRFFYGQDIELVMMDGSAIAAPAPAPSASSSSSSSSSSSGGGEGPTASGDPDDGGCTMTRRHVVTVSDRLLITLLAAMMLARRRRHRLAA